ncbi:MAG: nucleotidyltransferase family protein [Acidobacteriota bacterium]|nr:nucleotidyltransferase family protein [Acidobacteriota bacterium]
MKTAAINNKDRSVSEMYQEGIRYFMGEGSLNSTLKQLASDLEKHNIAYAVIGAVALLAHGYPRFTQDIDLVLTAEGLDKLHQELVGLGYAPAFKGSRKRLRAIASGVSVEVMLTGEYPGDGKPKPVSMPNPQSEFVDIDGVHFVSLEKLIELKLAWGMTAGHRLKDLADVQELIKARSLTSEFASLLNPYVRAKFLELYQAVEQANQTEEQ